MRPAQPAARCRLCAGVSTNSGGYFCATLQFVYSFPRCIIFTRTARCMRPLPIWYAGMPCWKSTHRACEGTDRSEGSPNLCCGRARSARLGKLWSHHWPDQDGLMLYGSPNRSGRGLNVRDRPVVVAAVVVRAASVVAGTQSLGSSVTPPQVAITSSPAACRPEPLMPIVDLAA